MVESNYWKNKSNPNLNRVFSYDWMDRTGFFLFNLELDGAVRVSLCEEDRSGMESREEEKNKIFMCKRFFRFLV